MLVGLQGSGKTTTSAKLATHLIKTRQARPFLVPLDLSRPAAIQQLKTLAGQVGSPAGVYDTPEEGGVPAKIAAAAIEEAKKGGFDTVIFDTAGRLAIDEELMGELRAVREAVRPRQTLLVADAMTGQDAVAVATGFRDGIGLDGVVLSKMEGDARAARRSRSTTSPSAPSCSWVWAKSSIPWRFFTPTGSPRASGHGRRPLADREGRGSLRRKQALELQRKLKKDEFTLEDFRDQLRAVKKMGSIGDLLKMIPGMKKLAKGGELDGAQGELTRIEAIIDSMTNQERRNHLILNGSRRKPDRQGVGDQRFRGQQVPEAVPADPKNDEKAEFRSRSRPPCSAPGRALTITDSTRTPSPVGTGTNRHGEN